MVVLQVLGMPSSVLSGVFCGVGALGGSGSWSVSEGVVSTSSGSVSCLLPAHGEGLNVVEVAVGRSGEMSLSTAKKRCTQTPGCKGFSIVPNGKTFLGRPKTLVPKFHRGVLFSATDQDFPCKYIGSACEL